MVHSQIEAAACSAPYSIGRTRCDKRSLPSSSMTTICWSQPLVSNYLCSFLEFLLSTLKLGWETIELTNPRRVLLFDWVCLWFQFQYQASSLSRWRNLSCSCSSSSWTWRGDTIIETGDDNPDIWAHVGGFETLCNCVVCVALRCLCGVRIGQREMSEREKSCESWGSDLRRIMFLLTSILKSK